jgi:hypothetical protein
MCLFLTHRTPHPGEDASPRPGDNRDRSRCPEISSPIPTSQPISEVRSLRTARTAVSPVEDAEYGGLPDEVDKEEIERPGGAVAAEVQHVLRKM